jgi:hypothetical protein
MKLSLITVLVAGLMSAAPAFSSTITIDFEGPTSFQSIDQYYNGGTDAAGASGLNLGVSFGLDALAIQNDGLGSGVNGEYFTNAPSPLGVLSPVGTDAWLNFATGFTGLASFYYSSTDAVTIDVFSGLNGTGTLLGSFNLLDNAVDGCSDSDFCNWSLASLNVNGVAKSIAFGDAAYTAGFDNVTISAVPEPSTMALLAVGLAGVFTRIGRRKETIA